MNEPTMKTSPCAKFRSFRNAVDERVAERDQRVDAAERQGVDAELDERVHRGSVDRSGAARFPEPPLAVPCLLVG